MSKHWTTLWIVSQTDLLDDFMHWRVIKNYNVKYFNGVIIHVDMSEWIKKKVGWMLENCSSLYGGNSTLINFLCKVINLTNIIQVRLSLQQTDILPYAVHIEYVYIFLSSTLQWVFPNNTHQTSLKNFVDRFKIPLPPFFNTDLVRSWITCKTRYSFNIWETSIFCWKKRKLVQHTRNKQEQLNLQNKMTTSSE